MGILTVIAVDRNGPTIGNHLLSNHRTYLQRDLKLLWGLAAARCAKCRAEVTVKAARGDDATVLGQIAHIVAHGSKGPRADASLSNDNRRKYDNLMWVQECLVRAMPQVTFAELEIVSKALVNNPTPVTAVSRPTEPIEKMTRNGLTTGVLFEIQQGMAKSKEVGQFLVEMSKLDPAFPERLRAGFLTHYRALRQEGVTGDALFVALRSFAAGNSSFPRQAAGLAVLVYLFETCELFER